MTTVPVPLEVSQAEGRRRRRVWVGISLGLILLLAALLRFANLGYSEFQGDEALQFDVGRAAHDRRRPARPKAPWQW